MRVLYIELNEKFEVHKKSEEKNSFDKEEWNEWSVGWRRRLDDMRLVFKQRSQTTLYPILPETERKLKKIRNKLSILWGLYANKLEEGLSPFSSMLMRAKPEDLNILIDELFNEVTEKVELPPAKDTDIEKSAS